MDPLAQTKVVIIVFAMHGCPACEDYLPRLYRQLEGFQKLNQPFVLYQDGLAIQPGQIPVMVCDSNSRDPSVVDLADRHQIHALPSTILLPRYGFPAKYEGGLTDVQIYSLLNAAIATNR